MSSKTYASCSFCPKCGVPNLERDNYRKDNEPANKKSAGATEFICMTCGLGFLLTASKRVEHGNSLFKQHRALRSGKD